MRGKDNKYKWIFPLRSAIKLKIRMANENPLKLEKCQIQCFIGCFSGDSWTILLILNIAWTREEEKTISTSKIY